MLPKSLYARLIALTVVTLILVQSVSVLIYLNDRNQIINKASANLVLERIAALIRLVDQSPSLQYEMIVSAVDSSLLELRLMEQPGFDISLAKSNEQVTQRLYKATGRSPRQQIVVQFNNQPLVSTANCETLYKEGSPLFTQQYPDTFFKSKAASSMGSFSTTGFDYSSSHWSMGANRVFGYYGWGLPYQRPLQLSVAVLLESGQWLSIEAGTIEALSVWDWRSALGLMVIGVIVIGLMILILRSNLLPLQALAKSAEAIGRGVEEEPLAEEGCSEVKSTIQAFNQMQQKQQRFIKDRMIMLAAISHDLKTPLTKLRLQAEFTEDENIQARQIKTLNDMEMMLEATMNFAKDDAQREKSRSIDLASLVQSVLCDFPKQLSISAQLPEKLVYECRAIAMRRLINNLVDNAAKYSHKAKVCLIQQDNSILLQVEDDGPGIDRAHYEQVFTPFFRTETSRNRETGGTGLGLSIVRSIALLHGGEVELGASAELGGLAVTITFPCEKNRYGG